MLSIGHVAVTVGDLEHSTGWYRRLFDAEPILDEDDVSGQFRHVVFALDNGQLFGLHVHAAPQPGEVDPRQPGLDHIAFACEDRHELQRWAGWLDKIGIAHDTIKDARYGSGISFKDPDGTPLEFFAPPA